MTTTTEHWSHSAIAQLRDTTLCPVCTEGRLANGRCPQCGANLAGRAGAHVWAASSRAELAINSLRIELERVPRATETSVARAARAADSAPSAAAEASAPVDALAPATATATATATASAVAHATGNGGAASTSTREIAPSPQGSSTTLQSVLAVAGAGLVATAAVVFTFFNPDLTAPASRGVVIGLATALFLVAAPLLMRRGLRFSAESVATLGVVLLALSTATITQALDGLIAAPHVAAGAALLGGAAVLALGLVTRLRAWMLSASLALALVPALWAAGVTAPASSTLGLLGTATAAVLLLDAAPWAQRRTTSALAAERGTLLAVALVAVGVTPLALSSLTATGPALWLAVATALLAAGLLTGRVARHGARKFASALTGIAIVASGATAALALEGAAVRASVNADGALTLVLVATGASAALIALGMVARSSLGARIHRPSLLAGALGALVAVAVPSVSLVALAAGTALFESPLRWAAGSANAVREVFGIPDATAVAAIGALLVVSATLALHAWLLARAVGRPLRSTGSLRALSLWLLALAGLGALGLQSASVEARIVMGLVLIVAASTLLSSWRPARESSTLWRLPVVLAAHAAVVVVASLSWRDSSLAVASSAAVLVALAAVARCAPALARPVHLALGYGYALVIVATALSLLGIGGPALLSLTATVGLLGAIAATFWHRLDATRWFAVLAVSSVPFALAVGLVVVERSGWSALSTATMLLLAVSLLLTRRPGLGVIVRAVAAGLLVPGIAVVLVDLGALVLPSSGSPIVLPIIAVVVALTLPAVERAAAMLRDRGMPTTHALAVRRALELSALVTGGIAIGLAYGRVAAGAPTALTVLLTLAAGCAAAGAVLRTARSWWLSGALATGALWTLWGKLGVDSLEAHLLPPSLGLALVGSWLTARGRPQPTLVGTALLVAIVPLVGLLVVGEEPAPARATALVLAAVALAALGASIHRGGGRGARRLTPLRTPVLIAAIMAAAAAPVQAARVGLGIDGSGASISIGATMLMALLIALAGAAPAAVAGILLARGATSTAVQRSGLVPALVMVLVAGWAGLAPAVTAPTAQWLAIWTAWTLMLGVLVLMVVAAAREQRGGTLLPTVPVLFALALLSAIAAWSPRELRVEWFSLPLGLMLILAGEITRRATRAGSWRTLGAGLVVLVLASVLATATDPQTWRAVLVMVIALTAILVGARWRLAAPFVLGIIVLPIENVLAFAVQIGRGIDAMPWWITLAVAGLVLLVIAVGFERRTGDDASLAARVRDLR